ncbi:cupin domain-containing protein [Algibacter miyuki]|uniref:Cupin domain-containing protein n=1 Tax=Algibacter miyuki TaxID=1306933 RepID=A0ABV5GVL5_9FLAO|nr:cupin domain-containing protein [Algibacter miyuki]MDN3664994.1 cupin domain-containing protein [Algibacter miyuki]
MKKQSFILYFALVLLSFTTVNAQNIPVESLKTDLPENVQQYTKPILENEIKGIFVEQIALTSSNAILDETKDGFKTIYLFFKGEGQVTAGDKNYDIVPETILLPNAISTIKVKTTENDTLHYLKISSKLTDQDLLDLKEFPAENTQNVYYAKFTDCEPYTEPIKSPNTVSRTIMPNKIIPRIAMGTVQTKGPDKVDPHEHPMLEQLFLSLSENNTIVYADEDQVALPEYALLHIPLGSSHSVTVEEDDVMYYVWMDFFLDKKGEEWLKTHKKIEDE